MMSTRRFHTIFLSMVILFAVGLDAGPNGSKENLTRARKESFHQFLKDDGRLGEISGEPTEELKTTLITDYKDTFRNKGTKKTIRNQFDLLRQEIEVFLENVRGPSVEQPSFSGIGNREGDSVREVSVVSSVPEVAAVAGQKNTSPALNPVQQDARVEQSAHNTPVSTVGLGKQYASVCALLSTCIFGASFIREAAILRGLAVTRKLQLVKETSGQELVSSWPKAFGLAAKKIITAQRSEAKLLRASLALLIGSTSAWVATRN